MATLQKKLETAPRGVAVEAGAVSVESTHVSETSAESASGANCDRPSDGSRSEDRVERTDSTIETEGGESSGETALIKKMTELLQAEIQAMTAQDQAVAVQHLPAFRCYTGEEDQINDDICLIDG